MDTSKTPYLVNPGSPLVKQNGHRPPHPHPNQKHWEALREQVISDQEGRCAQCGSTDRIEVHHNTYERYGAERRFDVIGLCLMCHKRFTDDCMFTREQSSEVLRKIRYGLRDVKKTEIERLGVSIPDADLENTKKVNIQRVKPSLPEATFENVKRIAFERFPGPRVGAGETPGVM